MAAVGQRARAGQVAVGEQHRKTALLGGDAGGVFAHHVGAVGVEGDFAETFRLALGIEIAAAFIQPHQRFVFVRVEFGAHGQRKRLGGHGGDGQRFAGQAVGALGQRLAVERQRYQFGRTLQHQRAGTGLRLYRQIGANQRVLAADIEIKSHARNQMLGRAVVFQVFGGLCGGKVHGKTLV